jgi:hypothetical protein
MVRRFIPVLLLLAASACGGVTDPSNNQNQPFSGTVQPGGTSEILFFNASKSGEITITVTNMTPTLPSGTFFVVAWGQAANGNQCLLNLGANSLAVVGATAITSAITPGSYCVAIQDTYQAFKTAEQFSLTVSHP